MHFVIINGLSKNTYATFDICIGIFLMMHLILLLFQYFYNIKSWWQSAWSRSCLFSTSEY